MRSVSTVFIRVVPAALGIIVIGLVAVVGAGLATGHRPVVLQTGSMSPTAPAGSLLIAAPRPAETVAPGDVLVMRRPGRATVTHRVTEVEEGPSGRFAITRGDANEVVDATPYPLRGEELVARWVAPGWGGRFQQVFAPGPAMMVLAAALVVLTVQALRWIWRPSPSNPSAERGLRPAADRSDASGERRRRSAPLLFGVTLVPVVLIAAGGVAWAMFVTDEPVTFNTVGTAPCFDAEIGGVQSGETAHSVDGTVTVPITTVDPTTSFVMSTIRSDSADPADAAVAVSLRADGAAIEFYRRTDAAVPPTVTVVWSLVSYGCGISVQSGTTPGNGTDVVDLTIDAVDPASSFVLVTSAAPATAADFGPGDLYTTRLADPTTLSIQTGGGTFSADRSFSWQVVTFDDPGDIDVQTVSASFGATDTSISVAVPVPSDPDSTFLLTGMAPGTPGPGVGDRMVRATFTDPTSIELSRSNTGSALDTVIQIVTLHDGTTVRHGSLDFSSGQTYRTAATSPADPTRSTVISTVAAPGAAAGGRTDHSADDVAGEGSATFELVDATTVGVERAVSSSNASFSWQVIEWAGPTWWDPNHPFRQRIDVETSTAAAPSGYSVPFVVDHLALVEAGLARADGEDVRVLRWDGSAWVELDRVLAEGSAWNTTDTTLWFRTTDAVDEASSDSYWLYFGDPAAGPAPADPTAVFPLVEGFESGLGVFEDRTGTGAWYRAAPWTGRIPLTVSGAFVASPLTGQAVLVDLTSAALVGAAQTDGSDLRFTAGDGSTPLAHETEAWDPVSGRLVAWVRVPALSAGADTGLYLYYGAADAPDQQSVRDVWSGEFGGVWHFDRDPAGPAPGLGDSSTASRDGLPAGAMDAADLVAGAAGDGLDFDGVDDRIDVGRVPLGPSGAMTFSAWVRPDAMTGTMSVAASTTASTTVFDLRLVPISASDGTVEAELRVAGAPVIAAGPAPVTVGTWHHVAVVHDGIELTVYVDGIAGTPTSAPGAVDRRPTAQLSFGARPGGGANLDGRIDEARLAEVARPAAALSTEAQDMNPGLVTAGAPETATWFDGGDWTFRKPISIDPAVMAGLPSGAPAVAVDVAVPLRLTDAELAASARADGADLVVTAADGVTRLDHFLELYDGGSGRAELWVRAPTIDPSATTELFLYYGNPTAVDQSDPVGVFGPDVDLVAAFG